MRCQPIKPIGANISFLNKKQQPEEKKQVVEIKIKTQTGDTFEKLPPKDGQE
mgnify:CR=1 FL=1